MSELKIFENRIFRNLILLRFVDITNSLINDNIRICLVDKCLKYNNNIRNILCLRFFPM